MVTWPHILLFVAFELWIRATHRLVSGHVTAAGWHSQLCKTFTIKQLHTFQVLPMRPAVPEQIKNIHWCDATLMWEVFIRLVVARVVTRVSREPCFPRLVSMRSWERFLKINSSVMYTPSCFAWFDWYCFYVRGIICIRDNVAGLPTRPPQVLGMHCSLCAAYSV